MSSDARSHLGFFSELTLFTGLEGEAILRLIELADLEVFSAGSVIVTEASHGDAIFILYEGQLAVETSGSDGTTVRLATIADRGSFFGEVALVDPGPRSASVLAESEATLLVLTIESLEQFYEEFPEARVVILHNIARVLAQRLRNANVQFAQYSSP
jgi:CRP-like cAMP-binding protein